MGTLKMRGKHAFPHGISIGASGTLVRQATLKSANVVLGNVDPNASKEVSTAVTSMGTADLVTAERPASLNDDILWGGARAGAGSIICGVYNATGGTIAAGTVTVRYFWIDMSA